MASKKQWTHVRLSDEGIGIVRRYMEGLGVRVSLSVGLDGLVREYGTMKSKVEGNDLGKVEKQESLD